MSETFFVPFAIIIFLAALVYVAVVIESRWRAQWSEAAKAAQAARPAETARAAEAARADAANTEFAKAFELWRARGAEAAKSEAAKVAETAEAEKRLIEEKRLDEEAEAKRLVEENKNRSAKAAEPSAKRRIFISYRRANDAGHAGWISNQLDFEREFDIFMDVDTIRLGTDFVEAINEAVAKCDVLLALIGRSWLDLRDEAGDRALDNPNDFVRLEIAAALERQIPVIPILIDGAKIPKADQLPPDLQQLARRQALDLRSASFRADMGRLVQELKAEARRTPPTS